MASAAWGNVYLGDVFVGVLKQDPGGRHIFNYDAAHLGRDQPQPIAQSLPLRAEPFIDDSGLHPFFDNLVAEGWLQNAQARALGINPGNRLALLLGFGRDLAGAVSIIDPEPTQALQLDPNDAVTIAALTSRGSLSGVQRKLLIVRDGRGFRPAGPTELSTHIAKLASGQLSEIVDLEFLTTFAARALLPGEPIVDMEIATLRGIGEPALVIPRFDRTPTGRKLHFEEFSQLLGRRAGGDKYEGAYENMANFIRKTPGCLPAESDRLYRRILACLLLGNTDAHFKNFAMFHTRDGLRLTPAYDLVASSFYGQYQTIALSIGSAANLNIGALQAKHIIALGTGFGLNETAIANAIEDIGKQLSGAKDSLAESKVGAPALRDDLIARMDKRWNGSFALTGKLLSKRQSKGGRLRTLRNSG